MAASTLTSLAAERSYVCARCTARRAAPRPTARRTLHTPPLRRQGLLDTLEQRGLVNQIAGKRDTLSHLLNSHRVSVYAGIDPTAPSLHLGHLLPLMVLFWLQNHGHNVISLIGGATARVGDPSGRLTSRGKGDAKEQNKNFKKMWKQTARLWEHAEAYGRSHGYEKNGERTLLDNASWLDKLSILDFLRVLGSGTRVGTMLGRDTVRNKMENGDGMSFAEFTYPLLQGWDWWHMFKTMGVQVQVGGADQYGNIIAGMDAVRSIALNEAIGLPEKEGSKEPMGLTVPLLTTSSGEKFGKSAGNAVWLDTTLTSSFDLYGFLLKTADADVERYLKLFTFIPLGTLSGIMTEHNRDPGKRKAQHLLASEVLTLVHGPREAEKTKKKHQVMRNPTLSSISQKTLGPSDQEAVNGEGEKVCPPVKRAYTRRSPKQDFTPVEPGLEEPEEVEPEEHGSQEQRIILSSSKVLDTTFPAILHNAGLVSSKSEGTRLIAGGGVYVAKRAGGEGSEELDFVAVKDLTDEVKDVSGLLLNGQLVLRLGKWRVRVIEVVDERLFDGPLFQV